MFSRYIVQVHSAMRTRKGMCVVGVLLICVYGSMHISNKLTPRLDLGPCKIPRLDPWDNSVRQYLIPSPSFQCSNKSSLMYVDERGYLVYNESALSHYSLTSLKCVYQVVHRYGDDKVVLDTEIPFQLPAFIEARVFRVVCQTGQEQVIYDFIHVNIAWNSSATLQKQIGYETDAQLSVIILGLDSVSRSHAIRNLPLSYKYLTETMRAYDFQGYMKIGKNTFPNVMPLLSGHEGTSLLYNIFAFDDSNMIWQEKVMQRYATHFSEDRPNINTFNFIRRGFTNPPTDYYYRPYALAMDVTEPLIQERLGTSSWDCYGNKKHVDLQFDYLKRFVKKYGGRLKFTYLWNNQMSHESFTALQHEDSKLLSLLQWLDEGRHLARSVLVVLSDHGFRLGGYSTTHNGRLENNMPFLAIKLPDVIHSKHRWIHEVLTQNTHRLVTAYDIHETLLNVVNTHFMRPPATPVQNHNVQRSLFGEIPADRTCEDAGIPPNYCTCTDKSTADPNSELVRGLAANVTATINSFLVKHSHLCHILKLQNVTEATVSFSASGDSDHMHINKVPSLLDRVLHRERSVVYTGRYELLFYTSPNSGLFSAMLDYEEEAEDGERDKVTLLARPSRLDRYAEQSACVKGTDVEEYCYCTR